MSATFGSFVQDFASDNASHRSLAFNVLPASASSWVGQYNYKHQRPLKARLVTRYAQCMSMGTFRDHTPVSFAVLDGAPILVNGQHTLSGIAQSGKPMLLQLELIRVSSFSEISTLYSTFDVGGVRTTFDAIVGLHEELGLEKKESRSLSVAVKLLMLGLKARTNGLSAKLERDIKDHAYVRAFMRDWKFEAGAYFTAIRPALSVDRELFMRGGVVATAMVTFRCCPDLAEIFWGVAAGDDGLRKGDPRKSLVNWLRANGASGKSVNDQHKACIACWNAFFNERQLTKVFTKPESSSQLLGCESFHRIQID